MSRRQEPDRCPGHRAAAAYRPLPRGAPASPVRAGAPVAVAVGDTLEVRVELDLGRFAPEDVQGELVLGHRRGATKIVGATVVRLDRVPGGHDGAASNEGARKAERSGSYAYGLRIRAADDVGDPGDVLRDLVRWIG